MIAVADSLIASMASKLPPEALKFAKQMGVPLDGLEAEAEDMWAMLNDMSSKDFSGYQRFIEQQFKEQKEAEEGGGEGRGPKLIRPTAGFSVETRTLSGDGLKVRVADAAGGLTGKVLYANVCSHEALQEPTDHNGAKIKGDWQQTVDLQIPLVVGPARDLEEQTKLAVDVLVHPSVVERCNMKSDFRQQVVELVLESLASERKMELQSTWSMSASLYMGGRGAEKTTPVLFQVEAPESSSSFPSSTSSSASTTTTTTGALQSPSMLLGALKQDREKQELGDIAVAAPPLRARGGGGKEDMNARGGEKINVASNLQIKKGFLNSEGRCSLYPDRGSSEGQGGATGGTLGRLMSRCQVVDTSTISVASASAPQAPTASSSNVKSKLPPAPSKAEMLEMEKLLQRADDDWTPASESSGVDQSSADDFGRALEEMSRAILGPEAADRLHPQRSTSTTTIISGSLYDQNRIEVVEQGDGFLGVCVLGLDSSLKLSQDVAIDVGKSELRVTVLNRESVKIIKTDKEFYPAATTAQFKKKTNKLIVNVKMS